MEKQICTICNTDKVYREAGENRVGKKYDAFWGCPNYKDQQHQDTKRQWNKPSNAPERPQSEPDGFQVIAEELRKINDRIDKLGEYLKNALGGQE